MALASLQHTCAAPVGQAYPKLELICSAHQGPCLRQQTWLKPLFSTCPAPAGEVPRHICLHTCGLVFGRHRFSLLSALVLTLLVESSLT